MEIDPSLLSKIEKGDKRPTKEQVVKLAKIFGIKENLLMVEYLSDRIVDRVKDEELAVEALKVAKKKIDFINKNNSE